MDIDYAKLMKELKCSVNACFKAELVRFGSKKRRCDFFRGFAVFEPGFKVMTPPSDYSIFRGRMLEAYEPFAKRVAEYPEHP